MFRDTVRTAVEVARDDWLVTIGIDPVSPSPAFGYIHLGDALAGHPGALRGARVRREAVGAGRQGVRRER